MGTAMDTEKARTWYRRAAEQGHVNAMHNFAVLSIGSRGDYATGAKWFAQAAERGLTDSQFNLAVLYQGGLGVAKDLKQAYQWLALAARGGDREAASRVDFIKSQLAPADLEAAEAKIAAWRTRAPQPVANDVSTASAGDE
jgi:localization factor PodJL